MKRQNLAVVLLSLVITGMTAYSQRQTSRNKPGSGDWSAPVNLGPVVNSASNDVSPALSRDQRSLYFTSTRPGGYGGEDIWVSRRTSRNAEWGTPVNLGPAVNSDANDRLRYLSPNGHLLLFQSNRPGGFGGSDIWASRRKGVNDDTNWEPPVNLGDVINTNTNELGSALLLGDQSINGHLYFASARAGGFGSADFYDSQILSDGSFGAPNNVVELNSPFQDSCLSISSDGLEVVFTSTRPDPQNAPNSNNLWTATRDSIFDAWSPPTKLGAIVNFEGFLSAHPFLSFDGQTLLFTSNRPGGFGGNDLYVTTREHRKTKE